MMVMQGFDNSGVKEQFKGGGMTIARWGFVSRIFRMSVALLVMSMLSSCGKAPSEPLRIASSPWPGYEPVYLARDIGYLPREKANIFELPSSDITLESFRNRSADLATLTLDETLELLAGGVKLRILFVMDGSNGGDAVMASPNVKTLADLKGKRVVITNIPLGVYMLSRTLNAAKLTREDVQLISSSESRHAEMYKQGRADVFVSYEPFKSQLAALGAHVIFDSSQIPDEIFDLMVVHEDVFQARRQEVCNVAHQWFRVLEYTKQSPEEATRRIAERLGVSGQEYQAMLSGLSIPTQQENLRLLGGKEPALVAPANNLVQVMMQEGQLKHRVDIRQALDADIEACIVK
ncbi:MAG: ABC transporter substrate-binding protein [Gallionella sp.]|nr:ABC transporter substrate-binding protein [Gallionella sp.]